MMAINACVDLKIHMWWKENENEIKKLGKKNVFCWEQNPFSDYVFITLFTYVL